MNTFWSSVGSIIFIGVLIWGGIAVFNNDSSSGSSDGSSSNYRLKEASTVNCKSSEVTLESVKALPGGEQFDAKTVQQVNEETPYCRDLCLQQLEYSKKYNDWFAEEDLRKKCTDLGIPLPIK